MDISFDVQLMTLAVSVLNLIVVPLIWFFYKHISKWRLEAMQTAQKKTELEEKKRKAWLALLRDRIMQSGRFFCMLGAIPSDVKSNLLYMGDAYLALGGNGIGHEMIENIKKLPVDDNALTKYYRSDKKAYDKEVHIL